MAQSTPEAELSSLNSGMNERGEPAITIWDTLLGHFHRKVRPDWQLKINLQEDNTTAIQGVRNGKNPTMETLERIFGTKIGRMHEQVMGPKLDGSGTYYNLIHTGSKHMSADIYTKGFMDSRTFGNLRQLINVFTPEQLVKGDFNPLHVEELPEECSDWKLS